MTHLAVDQTPALPKPAPGKRRALPMLVVGVALLAFISWLLNTPSGLLGKADAVGYAICHRIAGRSFYLGDRPLPLCARCTGIYLGALFGMAALAASGRARAGSLPARRVLVVLFGFMAVMGLDGANSYLTLFPGAPHLYQPQNWLRLVTGTLNGLALGVLIVPIFNQTMWRSWEARPALANLRELGVLVALAALVVAMVLSENGIVLYPLALLSAVGVVALLTALDTTLLLVVARRENRVTHWTGALLPLAAGFTLAILQIALVDAVRYAIFGTWEGFVVPG